MPEFLPNPHKGKTILLAEDEQPVRNFVHLLLLGNGYDVLVVENGIEALDKSREHTGEIHLLLSDVEMPQMTGTELATQIAIERPNAKIILMSGFPSEMLVLNHGWKFLAKPFDAHMLRETIRMVLDRLPSDVKPGVDQWLPL